MTAVSLLSGLVGVALIGAILWDAFETILVPRRIGRRFRLTRFFYFVTWRVWRSLARGIERPARRDAVLAFYGPLSLILLLACWAAGLILGFALLHVTENARGALSPQGFGTLIYLSGETFFTLGFGDITPSTLAGRIYSVAEAGLGFAFLGTVVGYLPTMYSAFSQREIEISLLDARAGSPPTAAEFLARLPAGEAARVSDQAFRDWERWSAQLLETHISYPQLAYYRSQHSNQSWLGTLTAILDSSALVLAAGDGLPAHHAHLTFAIARHALVDITHLFVPRPLERAPARLSSATLARLREALGPTSQKLPATREFEERLTALRHLYEPYAQALAAYLLFDLPPWIHEEARRDNWRGGAWDKTLASLAAPEEPREDHF